MSGEEGNKKRWKSLRMNASHHITYTVEAVRDKRIYRSQVQYLIKWEGWPESDNTWEPGKNLKHVKKLIDQFEKRLKSETEKPKRKRKRKNGDDDDKDDAHPSKAKAATSSSSRPRRSTRSSK